MGWSDCGDDSLGRPIGYGFFGTCDHPECSTEISRGLANVCGGMHGNSTLGGDSRVDWDSMDVSCEKYFCDKHMTFANLEHEDGADLYTPQLCIKCAHSLEKAYREDECWRDHWPTKSNPVEL